MTDQGGYVDYRKLISEELGIPEEKLGVVHGDNMLLITNALPLSFTHDQQQKIKWLVRDRVGSQVIVKFHT